MNINEARRAVTCIAAKGLRLSCSMSSKRNRSWPWPRVSETLAASDRVSQNSQSTLRDSRESDSRPRCAHTRLSSEMVEDSQNQYGATVRHCKALCHQVASRSPTSVPGGGKNLTPPPQQARTSAGKFPNIQKDRTLNPKRCSLQPLVLKLVAKSNFKVQYFLIGQRSAGRSVTLLRPRLHLPRDEAWHLAPHQGSHKDSGVVPVSMESSRAITPWTVLILSFFDSYMSSLARVCCAELPERSPRAVWGSRVCRRLGGLPCMLRTLWLLVLDASLQ